MFGSFLHGGLARRALLQSVALTRRAARPDSALTVLCALGVRGSTSRIQCQQARSWTLTLGSVDTLDRQLKTKQEQTVCRPDRDVSSLNVTTTKAIRSAKSREVPPRTP